MKIAAIQMVSSPQVADNLAQARTLLEQAAALGTELFAMVRGKGVPMVVSATPFLPPRYHRG